VTRSPCVEAMVAETPAGCCIVCENRLHPSRRRLCGSKDCRRVYLAAWVRGKRTRPRVVVAADEVP
jgi:hypothetical protein